MKRLDIIAKYFKVSTNNLLYGSDDVPPEGGDSGGGNDGHDENDGNDVNDSNDPFENEMVRVFRKLSRRKKACLMQLARTLLLDELDN